MFLHPRPSLVYTVYVTLLPSSLKCFAYSFSRPDFLGLYAKLEQLGTKDNNAMVEITGTLTFGDETYSIFDKPEDKMIACTLAKAWYTAYVDFCRTFKNAKLLKTGASSMILTREF